MKRILLLLLCFLFVFSASASTFEIEEDYTVTVDKNALLAALYEADISSLRQAIDLGLISCQELTEYYLERIEAYNDTFQCFITLCDNAVEVAKQRDAALAKGNVRGSLFGIPIVVKDNIEYEGYPTTNGYAYANRAPSEKNAAVVQHLLDEGAVILGKTNMSAGAQDAICSTNAAGLQTFNAYNPNLASGGSSGGSAVAVCLNFAAAGLGTDTNVSLRYPSALNGCVSLRPTFDLVDNEGCILLNQKRDTVGAITRTVVDQAIMLDAMTGSSYSENLNENALDGMRIGILAEFSYPVQEIGFRSDDTLDDEIQAAFDQAVEELTMCGAEVVTVSIPTIFNDIANSSSPSDRLYAQLETLLDENNLSAIIYPTYLHTPHYTTKEYLDGKNIYALPYICNCATFSPLTGAPEITVPIGTHSTGAGIGMEILSLKNNDQLLLDIAYSYTKKYDHRASSSAAPSLYVGDMELTLHAFLMLYEQALEAAETQKAAATEPTTIEPTESTEETTASAPAEDDSENVSSDASLAWLWYIIAVVVVLFSCGVFYIVKRRKISPVASSESSE
ncbi:MAG: amidase [Ruminococcaceae bacterium]|nr:amidase [Oscillospiraceae bacterium]